MESTEQTAAGQASGDVVDASPAKHTVSFLLDQLEQELEAVDAVSSYLSPFVLPASVHLQRAARLIEKLGAVSGDTMPVLGVAEKLNFLPEDAAARVKKVWEGIEAVQAYRGAPDEMPPIVSEDDLYSVQLIFKKMHSHFYSLYGAKGIRGLVQKAPSLLLLLFVPVLFYAVGFIYTKTINPMYWFKTGLEDFNVQGVRQDWGTLLVNKSVSAAPLQIAGRRYKTGFGTHANSKIQLTLNKKADFFSGACGVDDANQKNGSIVCIIISNGKELFRSEVVKGKTKAVEFRVPVTNVNQIDLVLTDAGDGRDYDHADWVDLKLE